MLAKDTHGRAQTRTHGKQPQPSIETEPIQCNRDRLPPMLVTLATSYMATGEPRELYRRRCAKTSRLKSEAAAGIPPKPKSLAFVSICCSMHSTESFTKHRPWSDYALKRSFEQSQELNLQYAEMTRVRAPCVRAACLALCSDEPAGFVVLALGWLHAGNVLVMINWSSETWLRIMVTTHALATL